MRWILSSMLVVFALTSCSVPSVDNKRWVCTTHADCGTGYLCSTIDGYCEAAFRGVNGVFDDHLVVGMVASLTSGGAQNLGNGMKAGIEAYFEHVNALGGVNGRTLQLMTRDDGYDPVKAAAATHELTDPPNSQVLALLGNVGTPTAATALPVAIANETIFFGAFTGAPLLRKDPPDHLVFNYRASYKQETAQLVNYFTKVRVPAIAPQNIAVMPQGISSDGVTTDSYGQAGLDGVLAALKGIVNESDVVFQTYERNTENTQKAQSRFLHWLGTKGCPPGDTQCRAMTRRCSSPFSAAIIMVPTYAPASDLVKNMSRALAQAKTKDLTAGVVTPALSDDELFGLSCVDKVVFSSVSFVGSDALADSLNAAGNVLPNSPALFCEGVVVSQVVPFWNSSSTAAQSYRAHLAAHDPNLVPGFVSFEGYLAAELFVEGLKKRGRDVNTDALVDTFEELSQVELGIGATLSFSPNQHQASQKVWGTQLVKDSTGAKCSFQSIDI